MYCSNCGKQIPDESNYCQNCGHPQKQNKPLSPVEYEICTLTYHTDGSGHPRVHWEAKSHNKIIGQSPLSRKPAFLDIIIPDPNFERTLKRLKSEGNTELVTQLAERGWEVLTTDKEGNVTSMRKAK